MRGIIPIIYLAIGVLVAASRDLLGDVNNIEGLISLLLSIVLWPLILLGVDINIGGRGGGKREVLMIGPVLEYLRAQLKRAR